MDMAAKPSSDSVTDAKETVTTESVEIDVLRVPNSIRWVAAFIRFAGGNDSSAIANVFGNVIKMSAEEELTAALIEILTTNAPIKEGVYEISAARSSREVPFHAPW
eukprot:GHVT01097528.1.p4 GENE.GHVT01097528.1~~GHVT01097528.1.p4  ORF type:complete len:106 (-),score=13.35 GHVT01097528.1:208-525(-)